MLSNRALLLILVLVALFAIVGALVASEDFLSDRSPGGAAEME